MSAQYTSPIAQLLNEFASSQLPQNNHSQALEASHVLASGCCYLVSFTVSNTNASAQYIQLHDANARLANGAIPAVTFTIAGSSDRVVTYVLPGRYFNNGIVIANSSTSATLTIGAADCYFDAQMLPVLF